MAVLEAFHPAGLVTPGSRVDVAAESTHAPKSASSDRGGGSSDEREHWKDRYIALEARLAAAKTTLGETRQALHAAQERDQATRARLAKVRERLRWHERALLTSDVVADLLPARAQSRRQTPADDAARRREATHADLSDAYAAARGQTAPPDAESVEIGGLTWWVPRDARVEGQLARRLVSEKRLPLVDLLRTREVISNGTMLDIGANVGLTSVTRAVLGDADVVYAAEPAPDNFACLVRTIVDNGLSGVVLPDRVAISDHDGTATLRLAPSIGRHALVAGAAGIGVPTMRLDTWVDTLQVDIAGVRFVKIDTQGHEAHVLAGAPGLLAREGIVWELEFSPRHLRKAGREPAALIAHMQSVFTHFIDLNPHAPGARLRPIAELGEALGYLERSFTNVLAYRRLT
jgi:FkbM family methyltransferase